MMTMQDKHLRKQQPDQAKTDVDRSNKLITTGRHKESKF